MLKSGVPSGALILHHLHFIKCQAHLFQLSLFAFFDFNPQQLRWGNRNDPGVWEINWQWDINGTHWDIANHWKISRWLAGKSLVDGGSWCENHLSRVDFPARRVEPILGGWTGYNINLSQWVGFLGKRGDLLGQQWLSHGLYRGVQLCCCFPYRRKNWFIVYRASQPKICFGTWDKTPPARILSPSCEIPYSFGKLNIDTPWTFNMAMEHGPLVDDLPFNRGDFPWLCYRGGPAHSNTAATHLVSRWSSLCLQNFQALQNLWLVPRRGCQQNRNHKFCIPFWH